MNKYRKISTRWWVVVQVCAIAALTGCTSSTQAEICHATGDPAIPYEQMTISVADIKDHLTHANDLYPVPEGGCPATPPEGSVVDDGAQISICHATGSQTNPYEALTVSANALNGHDKHEGDLIPAPEGGCPATPPEGSVNDNAQVSICHATGDETAPYEALTLNAKDLKDHKKHEGDLVPAPEGGCPATLPEDDSSQVDQGGKITICHATGSKKNSYNEITVSVNGLNGHGGHSGDIVPAPASGCPVVTKK